MISVLSKHDAFTLDESTISSAYLTEKELVDNAGKAIAQFIVENIQDPFNQKFIILVGPGHNGGDAIISHYYLLSYGINSELILFNNNQKEGWIFDNYTINNNSIKFYDKHIELDRDYWYVDGIFGIGLQRNIEGIYKEIIDELIHCPNIISIDIPSGIYVDSGLMAGSNIHANYTLTMGFPKIGHFFNKGLDSSGELHVLDIGFKPLSKSHASIKLIDHEDLCGQYPSYSENVHKYSRGKLVTISGSKGYTGACILAIQAAMKTGVGIIKAIIPESLNNIFESSLIEAISIPIHEHKTGTFTSENTNDILDETMWADAVIFGPGLEIDADSGDWMMQVLHKLERPLVLDASGFSPLIENKIIISELPTETILTPHYAEFSRIFKLDLKEVIENPISAVKDIIEDLAGRVLILKGATNIIVNSNGDILLINHGSSALATAGTGDVLTGILGTLLAQGIHINEASLLAVYLHGECVHQYNKLIGSDGLIASDLPKMIPYALNEMNYVY